MIKSTSLLICCLLGLAGFSLLKQVNSDRSHDEWLLERYFEATSIKEGMTRADLIKIFRTDGGLQLLLPTRYVLKSSNMIKVDVEFEVLDGAKGRIIPEDMRHEMEIAVDEIEVSPLAREGKSKEKKSLPPRAVDEYQFVPNEQLKIKSISGPYIEQFHYD